MLKFFSKVKSRFLRLPLLLLVRPQLFKLPYDINRLGTEYGGWHFAKTKSLHASQVVFCGAGEDISFDIAFAALYSANVFVVDPTQRAVSHVKSVISRAGSGSKSDFVRGGKQNPSSYDLTLVSNTQLHLVEYALWNKNCTLKFFTPKNPQHVSHSIVNYQNSYKTDSSFVEVKARTISSLIECGILPSDIEILKLDIEGAEHEVIKCMLDEGLRPRQILVEYDELLAGHLRGIYRFRNTHIRLKSFGYKLFYREAGNFSYILI